MARMNPALHADRAEFPIDWCRSHFPALKRPAGPSRSGVPPLFPESPQAVFFDGPAGSQVPQSVVDAISRYLIECNANHGGRFATSRQSDALIDRAHEAVADLFGTADAGTIAFGANMTTLTLALSRALAREWRAGDEILVTRLDHDANVSPWVLAARDAGASVRHVEIRPGDCTLDLADLKAKLSPRTRLVAVGGASNAVGTINPVAEIAALAHAAGAEIFVDAVHAAPHLLPDVVAWDCDYLVASAYKFFGPHLGVLWGRRGRLETLPAYKLRPAPDDLPGKWMTGTQSHEAIAGTLAAVEYLADLGRHVQPAATGRRQALVAAYAAIGSYERRLAGSLLAGLAELPSVRIYGITTADRLSERVPTLGIRHARLAPAALADFLDARGIFVWHGNFYALPLTEALGLEPEGLVRIGLLHYNTAAEVDRLLAALAELES
jgi:cysteine desulfurase family protein (TIGR01976 family)